MKKNNFNGLWLMTLMLTCSSVLFFSCNKDVTVPQKSGTDDGKTPQYNSMFNAVVGGDSTSATTISAVISDTAIVLSGTDKDGGRILLTIRQEDEEKKITDNLKKVPGLYTINKLSKHSASYKKNATEAYIADSTRSTGQISISGFDTINQVISGVFNFKGLRANGSSMIINGGNFRIHYILNRLPDADENDTVYSVNPNKNLDQMSIVVDTLGVGDTTVVPDTLSFEMVESFMYLKLLHMTGFDEDGRRVTIAVDPNIAVSTVTLKSNFGPNSAYYVAPTTLVNYGAQASPLGQLVVTENDKVKRHIVGTLDRKSVV